MEVASGPCTPAGLEPANSQKYKASIRAHLGMKWPPCRHGLNPNNALRIFSLRPLAAIYCYHILMNVSSSICFPRPILPYLTAVVGFLPKSCTHSTYIPDFPTICTLLSSLLHSPFTSPLNLFINAILLDTCGTFWREVPRFHPTLSSI